MNNVHERCVIQMCEKTYQYPGYEYSNQDDKHNGARESYKRAINREIRKLKLKEEGINLIYCALLRKGIKAHEIEIQESRGKYSFFLDGKNVHTFDNLADCETWAKASGYIDRREKLTEAKEGNIFAKMLSWKTPPVPGHHGWR